LELEVAQVKFLDAPAMVPCVGVHSAECQRTIIDLIKK
jgi:hypothetical protein